MILSPVEMTRFKSMLEVLNFNGDAAFIGIVEETIKVFRPYRPGLVVELIGGELSIRNRDGEQAVLFKDD